MVKGKIHIGTSGWSYKDWKGLFYPKALKSTDWLSYYSQTFRITEINSSFYHLPRKQTVEHWVQYTPDAFLFCPKMSRYLTHLKRLKEPEEPLERFFSIFEPMQQKMGPVLLQLPPSLAFDPEVAGHLFKLLKKDYAARSFALEVRHKSWLEPEALGLMKHYSIALVLSESGNRFPYAELVTARSIYIRFHGPNGRYNTSYDEATLQRFARLFLPWQHQGHELWIFFNNDFYGYAIQNALRLEALLQEGATG
jgi:uncharacterized protein YecE (DUF72 family)